MGRFNFHKNAFTAGELSPKLLSRTDLAAYNQGAKELLNMIALQGGGATARPGTQFVKQTEGNAPAILIPFIFSEAEAYVIELTANEIRIINTESGEVSEPAYLGSAVSYAAPILDSIQFVQSADVLYLTSILIKPQQIQRLGYNDFQVVAFDYDTNSLAGSKKFPFLSVNTTPVTLTISNSGGTNRLTSTGNTFDPGHVGGVFKTTISGVTAFHKVTGYVASTQVTVDSYGTATLSTATSDWEEGAWSDYQGWPRTIAFHEGRLLYGGNILEPDTIWGSAINNYALMMGRKLVQDASTNVSLINYFGAQTNADPFSFTLASRQLNQIHWMASRGELAIGTLGSEWIGTGADPALALGPLNFSFKEQSSHGSKRVQAELGGNAALFVSRSGDTIREFLFSLESDSYESEDLSVLGEHMARKGGFGFGSFSQIAWQECTRILWCLGSSGLVGLTRNKKAQVAAWHGHELGGNVIGFRPAIRSICVVPSSDGTWDDLWLSVQRTINGVTYSSIEKMGRFFEGPTLDVDYEANEYAPFFADMATRVVHGAPSASVTGLTHLAGEEVSILADGHLFPNQTVSVAGELTLPEEVTVVTVGLGYTQRIKLPNIEAGSAIGSAQGSTIRIERATMQFYNTCSAKVGSSTTQFEEIDFRDPEADQDDPILPFTGQKAIDFPASSERETSVIIWNDKPLPMTLLSITLRGVTTDA